MPIKPNPVNWFEIPVNDMARAITFYESVLGVELTQHEMGLNKMAWFPMEMGAAGATGTLMQGAGYTPSREGSVVYISVPQIDTALTRINDAGGETVLPRTSIGEHGFIAHFVDSEGNRVALHEAPSAQG